MFQPLEILQLLVFMESHLSISDPTMEMSCSKNVQRFRVSDTPLLKGPDMLSKNAIIRVVDVRNRIFKSTAALINLSLVTVEHLPQIVVNYPFWSDKTWILIADNCRLVRSDIMIFPIWDAVHAILLSLASAFSWVQPPSRTACKNSNFQTNSWWLGGGGEVLKGMVRTESPGLVQAKFVNVLFLEMVAHGNTNPRSLQVSTKYFPREFYSGPLASTNQWFV